jgi:ribosomal protein S18 acetylase RimI-like enzyme
MAVDTTDEIRTANEARAVSVITLAFSADPIARWVYPDPHQYYTYFPELVRAFAGESLRLGTALFAEDFAGAALWVPPGAGRPDDEVMGELIERSVSPEIQGPLGEFSEMQAALHPHEPMWYLPMIGVDPSRQRQGHGSVLLERMLEQTDADGIPAYLEATTPSSRALYERHGFEVVGLIQAGGSPPMWPMLRRPRARKA